MDDLMEPYSEIHLPFKFLYWFTLDGRPGDLLDVFQKESAGTIHKILKIVLGEGKIIRQVHLVLPMLIEWPQMGSIVSHLPAGQYSK